LYSRLLAVTFVSRSIYLQRNAISLCVRNVLIDVISVILIVFLCRFFMSVSYYFICVAAWNKRSDW